MRWRVASMAMGLAALGIAVASPVAHFDHHLLSGHMVHHLVLMVIAAPLILYGVRTPRPLHWRPNLVVCWLAGTLTVMVWHVPAIFELALKSQFWHEFEQAEFFIAGIIFWWPVVHPDFAARSWSIPIYLFLATLPCDALSAFLTFCGSVVYRPYASAHLAFGLSPLDDQALAGALMWVTVTFAYLIPALVTTTQLVSGERTRSVEMLQNHGG